MDYRLTEMALYLTIKASIENRNKKLHNHVTKIGWLKEFATIRFGISRRSGHTESIKKLIYDIFPKTIIIDNYREFCHLILNDTDCIVIDGYSGWKEHEIEEVYRLCEKFVNNTEFTLILLGT